MNKMLNKLLSKLITDTRTIIIKLYSTCEKDFFKGKIILLYGENQDLIKDLNEQILIKFKINRTDWGVKYGSGLAGAIGDNIISDDITLQISLEAK